MVPHRIQDSIRVSVQPQPCPASIPRPPRRTDMPRWPRLHEVGGVLVLNVEHLLIHLHTCLQPTVSRNRTSKQSTKHGSSSFDCLLRGHAATEERCRSEVAAVAGVRSAHPGTSDGSPAQGLAAVRLLLGDVEPRSMFLASNICWVSSGTCRYEARNSLLCKTSFCNTSPCIHIGIK